MNILYFRPDYNHILQLFHWQTDDITPDLPRVHKFLRYWKENINAVISEVSISEASRNWKKVDIEKILH